MYEAIIADIKSNLSYDDNKNRDYLISQLHKYENHEFSKEISREISRLLWNYLSDDERNEYIEISQEERPIENILNEVNADIHNGDFEKALNRLDYFLVNGNLRFYEDDSITEYHHFANPLEEILFYETMKFDKRIISLPFDEDYSGLYYIYGSLLYEFNRISDAEDALNEARRFNPVSTQILLRLGLIYKDRHDFEKWFEINNFAFDYAYTAEELCQIYRNFAFYHIIDGDKELGSALFEFSEIYEPNTSEDKFKKIYAKHQSFLIENNIPTEVNPLVLSSLERLCLDSESNNSLNLALYFYRLYYDLTKDSNIKTKILKLEENLENI
jgi:hypothetical protein